MRVLSLLKRRFFGEITLHSSSDYAIQTRNGLLIYLGDIASIERIDEPFIRLQEYVGEKCFVCNGVPAWKISLKNGDFGFLCLHCGGGVERKWRLLRDSP